VLAPKWQRDLQGGSQLAQPEYAAGLTLKPAALQSLKKSVMFGNGMDRPCSGRWPTRSIAVQWSRIMRHPVMDGSDAR